MLEELVDLVLLLLDRLLVLCGLLHEHHIPPFGFCRMGLDLYHLILELIELLGLENKGFELVMVSVWSRACRDILDYFWLLGGSAGVCFLGFFYFILLLLLS